MANKKIRLTYLWADESVMLYDFARKISAGMTVWANEFYARYGFEFDVLPRPLDRAVVAKASKYALAKNDGVSPDMRDSDVILEENNALVEKLWIRMEEKDKEIAAVSAEIDVLLNQLVPTQPTFDAIMARIDTKGKERDRLSREADMISAEWSAALRAGSDIVGRATGETLLRWQMASIYKAHKIGADDRVNVVFCKFRQLAMRSPSKVMGRAFVSPRPLIWLLQLQWPYSFIVVDIMSAERRTVAHEIVHVAGENHPLNIQVYEKLAKRIVSLKIPKGSLMGAPFSDVEFQYDTRRTTALPGGYFDGAPNDIMNYQLDDPTPDECVLADSDRQLMNNAWFVG